MSNVHNENKDRWDRISEVDYLGGFSDGWLAFYAWCRNARNEHQDRNIINELESQPDVVRNRIVSFLPMYPKRVNRIEF